MKNRRKTKIDFRVLVLGFLALAILSTGFMGIPKQIHTLCYQSEAGERWVERRKLDLMGQHPSG